MEIGDLQVTTYQAMAEEMKRKKQKAVVVTSAGWESPTGYIEYDPEKPAGIYVRGEISDYEDKEGSKRVFIPFSAIDHIEEW